MSNSTFPNVLASALFFGATAVFGYLQQHFNELGIPPIYAPMAGALIAFIIKIIAEWQKRTIPTVEASAAPRGLDGDVNATLEVQQDSFLARVLYK